MMDSVDPETGKTKRQMVAEHLLEVATRWQVLVFGRNLEVASGRDSVEAAKVLFSYVIGKPVSPEESQLKYAEHLRQVARDHVEIGRQLIGKQAETWSPEQIKAFWDMCERDPGQFLRAAQETLADASPAIDVSVEQPAIEAAPDELSSTTDTSETWKPDPDQSSPKGCDMASHDPEPATNRQGVGGAAPSTLDEDGPDEV